MTTQSTCHTSESWKLIIWWCNIPELTRLWCCGNRWLQQTMRTAPDLIGEGIYQPCLQHLQHLWSLDLNDGYFPNGLLAKLPPKLSGLCLDNTFNSFNMLELEKLPTTLTILKLKLESIATVNLTVLPRSLTELSIEGKVKVDMPLVDSDGLSEPRFPSLRSLSLRVIQVVDSGSIFMHCPNLINLTSHVLMEANHQLLHLPQQLEQLSVNMTRGNTALIPLFTDTSVQVSLTIPHISVFPNNLTKLRLTVTVEADMLNSLPVTLTDLFVGYIQDRRQDQYHIFSRFTRLCRLTLDTMIQVMPDGSVRPVVDLTSLSSTLTHLRVLSCPELVVSKSVTDLDLIGPVGFDGDFGDITSGITGPIGPTSRMSDLIPYRDGTRIEIRKGWVFEFTNAKPRPSVTALHLDPDSKLRSVRGIRIGILEAYPMTYFSNLTCLFTYYHIKLHTFLAQLPNGQLTDLTIGGSYDFGISGQNSGNGSDDISDLLIACCNCHSLRSLDVSIIFHGGNGSYCLDTVLPLPNTITTLVLRIPITLPGLTFPTSMEVLTLAFVDCTTTEQLQQLSTIRLREFNVISSMSASGERLWMILNALPQCVNIIRCASSCFNTDTSHRTHLITYIQHRKRFLRVIELA